MKTKDFLRLPLDTPLILKDKYYTYDLKKTSEDGRVMYSIFCNDYRRAHCCLFEDTEPVDDHGRYGRKIIIGCTSVGSISFHSDSLYWSLKDLKLVPRSSYLKTFPS